MKGLSIVLIVILICMTALAFLYFLGNKSLNLFDLTVFITVGFLAQMIDGALGMAWGVSSNTFLLSLGIPPAMASASVHAAEILTTAVSGLSHLSFGNVDKSLFKRLLIPGVIGGALGAYMLTAISGNLVKPFVSIYLLVMGSIIIYKALKKPRKRKEGVHIVPLAAAGGFFDAVGGGGWGPIVTSTLIAKGNNPRFTIGSVNLAEFFVTLTETATFFTIIGLAYWNVIAGLILGGVLAAPLAAYTCKKLPQKALMIMVGALITALSIRTVLQSLPL